MIDRRGEHVSGDFAPDRIVRAYNLPFPEPRDAVPMGFDLDACRWCAISPAAGAAGSA